MGSRFPAFAKCPNPILKFKKYIYFDFIRNLRFDAKFDIISNGDDNLDDYSNRGRQKRGTCF